MAEEKNIKPGADAKISAVKPEEKQAAPKERPAPHWNATIDDDDEDDLFDDVPV